MKKWAKVRVPASTSNLGPGFDVLGLALDLFNEVEVRVDRKLQGVSIEIEGEGKTSLPRNENNVIWKTMEKVLSKLNAPTAGYELKFINRIPLARGLGSSAAAILSGVLAGNAISGSPLKKDEVFQLAAGMEGHPDNVAPQLFGGLCVSVFNGKNFEVIQPALPKGIQGVVCVPDFELSTAKARAVLPESIPHKDAVFNASRTALFLSALAGKRFDLLKLGMEDRLHQPYRKTLIPGFDGVLEEAYRAGAFGVALSGAGPSIFAFTPLSKASGVGRAMEKGFSSVGVKAKAMALKFNMKGSEIFSK
ncbi:MAG: homoserine kinase [Elusimicrobia bacterium RIFCSPLOWO2_01_FULL_54_10]|nr:MAG: homoserine kinase [Elusimicrobia bacterium RIFCSPLOWO2_01_FULL_54_10]